MGGGVKVGSGKNPSVGERGEPKPIVKPNNTV